MSPRTARPGEQARTATELPVALRFRQQDSFAEERAANFSTGGMFVRSRRPHPVGTVFEFELRPGGGRPPITGKAQVAWVRRQDEAPQAPAGMGSRFVELDDDGRRRLAELAGPRRQGRAAAAGPAPGEPAAEPPDRAGRRQPTPPPAGPPVAVAAGRTQAASRSPRLPWLLLPALAVVVLLGATLWPRSAAEAPESGARAAPAPLEATSEAPGEATTPAPGTAPGEPAAAARPPQLRRVEEWARAWTEQRVDDYLAAYSDRFEPPGGIGRDAWERRRRQRIQAPRRIEVGIAFVELEELAADRTRVRFVQAYESDSYRDVVRKVLEFELEAGGWKIVRESVER